MSIVCLKLLSNKKFYVNFNIFLADVALTPTTIITTIWQIFHSIACSSYPVIPSSSVVFIFCAGVGVIESKIAVVAA